MTQEIDQDRHWKYRIEQKIDTLQESMISLARAEEKLVVMEEDRREIWEKLNKLTDKLDKIEKLSADSARTISVVSKVFWLVLTVTLGATATYFITA